MKPDIAAISRNDVIDYTVDLSATYDNPFDSSDISLDLAATYADGSTVNVPGFYFRPYERSLSGDKEVMTIKGPGEWHVRFSPRKEHAVTLKFSARDRSGTTEFKPMTIDVAPSDSKGIVQVSKVDPRFFAFENGTSFWPLGPNACWGNDKGTFSYDEWFGKLSAQKANYSRLWLDPALSTFSLTLAGKPADGKGIAQIDLANAWRLDYVLNLAKQDGIYLMLCIESFNTLRSASGYPYWKEAAENEDNGGPLRNPRDFWTSDKMAKLFKDKLRYIVARYGAYDNTMAWELWNEVDLVDEFNVDPVREWHAKMADYIRSIDVDRHMITTSFASSNGFKPIDLMPNLDYFQTHHYGGDPAAEVINQQSRKGGQGKPHYVGEIGADAGGPRAEDDPTGVQVHDPIWASIATGSSGAAAAWWWDNLIAPKDLFSIYGAASKFVEGVDWANEGFRQTKPSFAYVVKPTTPQLKDLEFMNGPVSWERNGANTTRTVRIDKNGVASGDLPVPGILHGRQNHPELFNPVFFQTNFAKPEKFELQVGDVSGYGGSGVQIELDGIKMIGKTFADPDGNDKTDSLTQYTGSQFVTIPAGSHTLTIYSTGPDWFMAGFRFLEAVPRTGPAVEGWSVVGETTALAWVRREGRSWRQAISGKQSPSTPSVIGLTGLAMGRWKVEVWDTWKGAVMQTSFANVTLDGKIRVNLPSISKEVAVKMMKQ